MSETRNWQGFTKTALTGICVVFLQIVCVGDSWAGDSTVKNSRVDQERLSVEEQQNDEVSSCWYRPKFAKGTNVEPVRIFFAVNRDGSYQTRPVVLSQQLDRMAAF